MKLKELQRTFIIVALVAAGFLFFKKNKAAINLLPTEPEQSQSKQVIKKTKEIPPDFSANTKNKTMVMADLKKCGDFLNPQSGSDLNLTLMQIKKRFTEPESLELTEYLLRSDDKSELIVQQNLHEELKNQIRVFKTGEDGFPDRVKDFPNFNGNLQQRLEGALTLGKLERKIDKFNLALIEGSRIRFEKQDNKITRIDFTSGRNQLICEDNACACTTY